MIFVRDGFHFLAHASSACSKCVGDLSTSRKAQQHNKFLFIVIIFVQSLRYSWTFSLFFLIFGRVGLFITTGWKRTFATIHNFRGSGSISRRTLIAAIEFFLTRDSQSYEWWHDYNDYGHTVSSLLFAMERWSHFLRGFSLRTLGLSNVFHSSSAMSHL